MSHQSSMFIDGRRRSNGAWIEAFNPADPAELVGTLPAGTRADVAAAVDAAAAAFPGWSAVGLEPRLGQLAAAAGRLGPLLEDAARVLTQEMGKILDESRADAGASIGLLAGVGGFAEQALAPQIIADDANGRTVVERVPVGVVGVIVPWNWPLTLLMLKVAPALAAGNTLVCVPSPSASLAVVLLFEQLAQSLPPGVLNIVTGHGAEVGAALAGHPGIRAVSFTGGTATGASVLHAAADNLTIAGLELGGNDAAVVLDDFEVTEPLVERIVSAALVSSGQVCFAIKRIYAAQNVVGELLEAATAVIDRSVVGNGLDPDTTLGPLANAAQFDRAREIRQEVVDRGGRLVELGRRGARFTDRGYFMMPALVTDVDESFRVVADEQFAPLLPVIPVATEEEAIRRANDTTYGLSSSVWSSDVERARGVARRLEAGTTFINQHNVDSFDIAAPIGGVKHSGLGREGGVYGFEELTELHAIIDRRVAYGQ